MKSIVKSVFATLLLAVLFTACKKDETKTYLNPSGTMVLTTNQTTIVLLQANETAPGVAFTWGKANFGFEAGVVYTLQMKKAGTAWGVTATSNDVDMGKGLTKSYTIGDFNKELIKFLPATVVNDIDVRIRAVVGTNVAPQYSNEAKIKVTPYKQIIFYAFPKALNVAGNYQTPNAWTPSAAPQIVDRNGTATGGDYEGYINFANASPEFKLVKGDNWGAGDLGMNGPGTLNPNGGNNLTLPNGGVYKLNANRTSNTWSFYKINGWAIIGSATPGGWGSDTQMTFNAATGLYTITSNLQGGQEMKFRANNDWAVNFGDNGNDGTPEYGGSNIPIALSGNYTITLDLLIGGNYGYTIKKN